MKNKIKKIVAVGWIYALLMAVMVTAIAAKKNYQMDEIYSYGLANNVGHTSIHPHFGYTYENPAQPFLDYMVVESDEPFSIANCWYNQERESSPPFYYFAVYLVCFWFKERFTRWSAGLVNLIFISFAMIMFRKILKHFEIKGAELNLCSIFFMISPAIINIVVFFRMYTMCIFAALFLTATILQYRNRENWKFYVLMILGSVFGVLTHYYMIFFLFFLSLVYGISLLTKKAWLKAGKYILSMAAAGGLSYLIFPGMIPHLFTAGRGAEGLENLQGGLELHLENLKGYQYILNREFFGHRFDDFVKILICLFIIGIIVNRKELKAKIIDKINMEKVWDYLILIVPTICYVVMIAKVAPYQVDRYASPTFGLIVLIFLLAIKRVIDFCLNDRRILKIGATVIICFLTLWNISKDFHITYLYRGDVEMLDQMATYSDVDALCVTSAGWRISGNFNDMILLNSLTFFQNEIDSLEEKEELKAKDEFILYVVDNDPEVIIDRIYEICPQITECEEIGKIDVAKVYHLYAK